MNESNDKISWRGLSAWLVCALFFMYEFLLRTVLGTFQSPLTEDLHLTPVSFALLSSTAYQTVYALMQIPVGLITARFGLKKTLFLAVMLCVLANICFSMSPGFRTALLFRLLMGFGSAFGFVCLLVSVYEWLPRKHIAFYIGLSQFLGTIGPMVAAGPLESLSNHSTLSWRVVFQILSLFGLGIAVLVLFFVDNNRKMLDKFIVLRRPLPIMDTIKQLLSRSQVWIVALFSAGVYFSLEYLSENQAKYFLNLKGFSNNFASYMLTLGWLGYALGCSSLGFISDQIHRRKGLMGLSALCSLIALIGIIYFPLSALPIAFCFFLLGIGASGQSIGFAVMAENCKEAHIAVGLGFNNAIIGLFSAVNAPIIGGILAHLSAYPGHPLLNYKRAFMVMVALSILAAFMSIILIKETYCKSKRENLLLARPKPA